jgi:hypothetical protein
MPKSTNELEMILDKDSERLQFEIASKFTSYTSKACACGKPVVFIFPSKEFECSRCGKKWQLCVEVREVNTK